MKLVSWGEIIGGLTTSSLVSGDVVTAKTSFFCLSPSGPSVGVVLSVFWIRRCLALEPLRGVV